MTLHELYTMSYYRLCKNRIYYMQKLLLRVYNYKQVTLVFCTRHWKDNCMSKHLAAIVWVVKFGISKSKHVCF